MGFLLAVAGCSKRPQEIPARFQGEFSFNKSASVAYWDVQSDWPIDVKDKLAKMAIPTTLRIGADTVVITDVASGHSVIQQAKIVSVSPDIMELELHSNFSQTNKVTTFRFDIGGFWLCEGTLFPNYRERFERVRSR